MARCMVHFCTWAYRSDPLHPASLYLWHNNFLAVGGFVEVFHCRDITMFFGGTVELRKRLNASKCQGIEKNQLQGKILHCEAKLLLSQQKSFESLDRRLNSMHEFARKASQPHIRFKFNCFLLSFHLLLSFRVRKNGVKSCHKAEHFTLHTRDSLCRMMGLEAAREKQTFRSGLRCIIVF